MGITETQLAKRSGNLGGSDVARIITGEFGGAAAVQYEKLYELEPATSIPMELGNDLEPSLLDYTEQQVGPIRRNVERRVPGTVILVHLDAMVVNMPRTVEGKTSGLLWTPAARHYGEPGTAEVPDYVDVQIHAGFAAVEDADLCYVPVWHPHRGKVMYEVPRIQELVDAIVELADPWWQRHVVNRYPCEINENQATHVLDLIKRTQRTPGTIVQVVNPGIVDQWDRLNKARLAIAHTEEHAKAVALQQLGDADVGVLPDGRTLEYIGTTERRLNQSRLRIERPDVYEAYVEEKTKRTPRLKAASTKRKGLRT